MDEARVRAEEGEDFTDEVPDSARIGTLHNMLAPTLLNADAHPTLEIHSEQLMETGGQLNATMALQVAGRDSSIEAPFVLLPASYRVWRDGGVRGAPDRAWAHALESDGRRTAGA